MQHPPKFNQAFTAMRDFFKMESAGGLTLMATALLAMIIANSAWSSLYTDFLDMHLAIKIGGAGLDKPLFLWINDGLMSIFFFLIGMEIKREMLDGQLSTRSQAVLPFIAAVGGMAVPALIYTYFNTGNAEAANGWAIPSATDIAFSLGILALFGKRVPFSLKIFLMAVAVIDDLGAIIIIALFYTSQLSVEALLAAAVCLIALLLLNQFKSRHISAYVFIGILMWIAVLKSGVHATIAGVLLGFMIPHRIKNEHGESLLQELVEGLHPWVAFGILPLFAFANAGISLEGLSFRNLLDPVPLGIALGLFIGKQIGIFSFSYLAIIAGIGTKPHDTTWRQLYGVAILCGIGFTMSLFIGNLAFDSRFLETETRIGVMCGSLLSALFGCLFLHYCLPKRTASQ
jgi:NhaA family Na+:H+ antiporter